MRQMRNAFIVLLVMMSGSLLSVAQRLEFNEWAPEFGAVTVDQRSAPKILSIFNASHGPVLLRTFNVLGDFAQSNECPVWLIEQTGCLVFLVFTPSTPGFHTGKLTVVIDDDSQQTLLLQGFGFDPTRTNDSLLKHAPKRTVNNEELAYKLVHDKRYSFQALLSRNAADIANDEKVFALTRDTKRKERIASILVSIGVRDSVYVEYLNRGAKKALAHDHDIPWPTLYDDHKLPKSENPALVEWCRNHNVAFWDMYNVAYFEIPQPWYYLGAAGNPEFYDLLIRGLHSSNPMIQAQAAFGLAKIGDPHGIEDLISVGQKANGEAVAGIVQALIYFPEPRAQKAAEELTPQEEKNMIAVFRHEKEQRGLRALFPW